MLILTRKIGEKIMIGKDAEVEVNILGVCGRQIRIGVTAPEDIPIHREEIWDRIKAEKTDNEGNK